MHLPIIAVTANVMQGESERCRTRGMDDYLAKPLRLFELGPMLAKWLPWPEGDASALAPAEFFMPEAAETDAVLPVWDALALTRMVGDNPAMHRRVLEKFLAGSNAQITSIVAAADAGDAVAVAVVAHAFKSSSRAVGAMQLGDWCQQMEMAGKAGDDAACRAMAGRLGGLHGEAAEAIRAGLA